jgi:hypothetical protein
VDIQAGSDGSLLLSYDSTGLSRMMAVVGAVLFAAAAYYLLWDGGDGKRLIAYAGAAATCALAAVVLLEQARLVIDPATRTVVWTRRWAFRTHRGSLRFDDISAVYAERSLGDSRVPSRRIVISTRAGETVPLTAGYRPDADRVILGASEQIRALLGQNVASVETVQAMVNAGRIMDAIAFLRDSQGLSLADAKQRVDACVARGGARVDDADKTGFVPRS